MSKGEKLPEVSLYTDGGCRGNPGHGAWAAMLVAGEHRRVLGAAVRQTTNNQMELTAVIEGLRALTKRCRIRVHSDSRYLIQGMTEWVPKWKEHGWRTAHKKPVINRDLWEELDRLASRHEVSWIWVPGHAGHPENEECDRIVNDRMDHLEWGEVPQDLRIDERL